MLKKIIIIAVILVLIITVALLVIFGREDTEIKNREYDAAVVVSEAKRLIEESEKLNELLLGEGIKYDLNPAYANGYYYRADEFSLDTFGVTTVSDIKNLMRKTFSEGYSNQLFNSTVFTSAKDANDNIVHFARYIQKGEENSPEYILVYSQWEPFLYDETTYDYTSVRAIESKGEKVYVEISCSVKDSESEKTEKKTLRVALIEESVGWRIDSPTYCEIEK